MKNPCRKCTARYRACHDTCTTRKEWVEEQAERKHYVKSYLDPRVKEYVDVQIYQAKHTYD